MTARELLGDVDDPILLSGDGLAPAELDQDVSRIDAEAVAMSFGMQEERGVDAGVAERDRLPVGQRLERHEREHVVLGGVAQAKDVEAVVDAHLPEHRGEQLRGRVTRARAEAAQTTVDLAGARLHRGDRVADRQAEVVVTVEAHRPAEGVHTSDHPVRRQRACGVDDVHARRAIDSHQRGLLGERGGLEHVRHHQEPDRLESDPRGGLEVLLGDVGLGAVGRDADDLGAAVGGRLEVAAGADPGQQQDGNPGLFDDVRRQLDEVELGTALRPYCSDEPPRPSP